MGTSRTKFDPDWVVAPADMLQEWMEETGVSVRLLAVVGGGTREPAIVTRHIGTINHVLKKRPMTKAAARLIGHGTLMPPLFWLALEHNYRYGLARGKKES